MDKTIENRQVEKYEGLTKDRKKTSIGGQALLEGILMKGPKKTSIAIRKPDGEIVLEVADTNATSSKYEIFKLPILRGVAVLFDSMKRGMKALDYSFSFDEEYQEEIKNTDPKKEKISNFFITIAIVVLVIGIFFLMPTYVVNLIRPVVKNELLSNLLEGAIRIGIFLVYVKAISLQKDIKRVFMYHGAEHKTINTYESGEELTVENVKRHSILHPRCGTSFMINLVIIGAIIFSILQFKSQIVKIVVRILSIPILVGITYELNKWMGGSDSWLSKQLSKAGMFLQKTATVIEPDDGMIEVAIEAMKAVIPENEEDDLW